MAWNVDPDSEMMRHQKRKTRFRWGAAALYVLCIVGGVGILLIAGILFLLMPLHDCSWGGSAPCGAKWTLGEILAVGIPAMLGATLFALPFVRGFRGVRR